MLPPELQALLTEVDACEADAARVVHGLSDVDVNRAPPRGGWSVAQCLEHLTLMNEFYLRGWPEAVTQAASAALGPFRGLHPTPIGRWFAKAMEPPVRLKGKAISAVAPRHHIPGETLLRDYTASHATYRHLVQAAAAVDVNRVVRPNAIVRQVKMRLSTVLLIIPAHDRRHLWQAAQVRAAIAGG